MGYHFPVCPLEVNWQATYSRTGSLFHCCARCENGWNVSFHVYYYSNISWRL